MPDFLLSADSTLRLIILCLTLLLTVKMICDAYCASVSTRMHSVMEAARKLEAAGIQPDKPWPRS